MSNKQIPAEELKRMDAEATKFAWADNKPYPRTITVRQIEAYIAGASAEYLRAHSFQPSTQGSAGMRWVNGDKEKPKPVFYEEPETFLVRIKGDDPRSGWIWAGYMTLEEINEIRADYWEWLEEIPSTVEPAGNKDYKK